MLVQHPVSSSIFRTVKRKRFPSFRRRPESRCLFDKLKHKAPYLRWGDRHTARDIALFMECYTSSKPGLWFAKRIRAGFFVLLRPCLTAQYSQTVFLMPKMHL